MRIILSPAKKMKTDTDSLPTEGVPELLPKTEVILEWLRSKPYRELQALWGCNDKIAQENFDRLQGMNLRSNLTPAILSYEGIAYQYMAPSVFEVKHFAYIQAHLRILSAFYGCLKPYGRRCAVPTGNAGKSADCRVQKSLRFLGRRSL